MRRIRTRVRELTPRARCHEDLRRVIAGLNPFFEALGLCRLRGTIQDPGVGYATT